ncbi:Eukaryotic translation initiation factor 2A [Ordospora colligata]|uniref:Eukaryotic translation initiation factor eIF2A n=1 Tax=Ordospora colligata OC4 TaxID=1354746 RepID=A0A0B2UIP5_9MICR|nr:eukaryotic translation initiation factor eIF2A [Ordospora colligata OC4]KHN68835.1 eukaryotic translation initiation factor eIF2A [Ordospora colligata OC4]TBU13869.1 eukaryotic translation initiation factor eIF2A [Ordospora colligata]TBU14058.1 eukaryotic translation initiation factor eIF2A [Ordospora colligata]
MPIAAHCEKGLSFDVFKKDAPWIECECYCIESSKVAWSSVKCVKYYDLKKREMIFEMEVDMPREIKMSENGENVGVLASKGELVLFGSCGVKMKIMEVSKFRLSDDILAYASNGSFFIHKVRDGVINEAFHNSKVSLLDFYISGEYVFLATKKLEKDGCHKILRIGENALDVLYSLPVLQGFSLKSSRTKEHLLFLLMTSYVNNSYFPESDLFLYDRGRSKFESLGYSDVHSYAFLSDGFAVCHGSQPSDVCVHEFDGRLKYKFPEGVRNRMFFNHHENLAVFAGFDNLSGDIEVFCVSSRRLISKFNVLGASIVNWSENGSYFYVSTTSYFQEDNKITLYDYFGRIIDEKCFDALSSVNTYGDAEGFVKLSQPSKLVIEVEKKYVPPSIHEFRSKGVAKGGNVKKDQKRKDTYDANSVLKSMSKPNECTKESILKDLDEIKYLKEKMKNGEELSTKELNLILKEAKLRSELKKIDE